MKRKLSILLTLICAGLFASCTVYVDRPDTHAYTKPAPDFYTMRIYDNTYVFYDANEPVARWIFNPDGTVFKEGDVITGIVRVYYDNGYLFSETYYRDGIRDGLCRQYYPDGSLMYSGYYSLGYRNGSWRSYVFNGTGQVFGTFEFSGHGEEPPAGFNPQMDEKVRAGYGMMMLEDHYVNKPVIKREFNRGNAVPQKFDTAFGSVTPQATAPSRQTQEIKTQNKAVVYSPQPAANQGAPKDNAKQGKKKADKIQKPNKAKPGITAGNAPSPVTGQAKAPVQKKEKTRKPKAVKQPAPAEQKTPEDNKQKRN